MIVKEKCSESLLFSFGGIILGNSSSNHTVFLWPKEFGCRV